MGSLSHPSIVQFEEAFELPDQSWVIVLEYCEGGDLFGQLSRLCDAEKVTLGAAATPSLFLRTK
jgi:serine/threonine protein kinase